MHRAGTCGWLFASLSGPAFAADPTPLVPGTYTNEEEVYFDTEAKKPAAPWLGISVDHAGKIDIIDRFGATIERGFIAFESAGTPDRLIASFANRKTELRRARFVTCWASVLKDSRKPDGSEDWFFKNNVKLHDQGGRALIGQGQAGIKPVVLRIRNVTWSGSARSTNRPSLVMYVHTVDDPDRAVSYVWADTGAKRIGVNLRWMQASCTIDGMEGSAAPMPEANQSNGEQR